MMMIITEIPFSSLKFPSLPLGKRQKTITKNTDMSLEPFFALHGTAVRIVWSGEIAGEALLARPQAEQDFISSLGVRETSVDFARAFVVTFLCLSATKIIQGIFLLLAILKSSVTLLRTWLVFELCTFVSRIAVFILLFTLGNCKPAMIFVHSLTFAVEFFLCYDCDYADL